MDQDYSRQPSSGGYQRRQNRDLPNSPRHSNGRSQHSRSSSNQNTSRQRRGEGNPRTSTTSNRNTAQQRTSQGRQNRRQSPKPSGRRKGPIIVALLVVVLVVAAAIFIGRGGLHFGAGKKDIPLQNFLVLTTFTFEEGAGIAEAEKEVIKPLIPPPRVNLPPIVMSNPAATGKVCLTFDDGPYTTYTDQYLDLLAEYNVPAMFFCPANRVQEYPELSRKIVEAGHELASHSKKHDDLRSLPMETLQADFQYVNDTFKEITGKAPKYLRPPYGGFNDTVLSVSKSYGQQPVFWSIDTNDWRGRSTEQMVSTITSYLSDGAIILFHEGKQNTLAALPQVIQAVRDAGYEFVSMDELLSNYKEEE